MSYGTGPLDEPLSPEESEVLPRIPGKLAPAPTHQRAQQVYFLPSKARGPLEAPTRSPPWGSTGGEGSLRGQSVMFTSPTVRGRRTLDTVHLLQQVSRLGLIAPALWEACPPLHSAHKWNSLCFAGRVLGRHWGRLGIPGSLLPWAWLPPHC